MSEVNRLSNRNKAIQDMLTDGNALKNFYRFAAQNPHTDLHDACQIVIDRPNASVCFSYDDWNAMGRRVSKGRKGIPYFDREGNRQFVFDANDTNGETRFKRYILPMKILLEGLDELNGTDLINSSRRDYQKILSGVAMYMQQNEGFSDDEERNRLLAEGVAYSLYSCTSFPKDNGIHIMGYPYSLTENAQLFIRVREQANSLQEEIEDAYLRRQQAVPVIEDIEDEVISDEPIVEERKIVTINSAAISQYKGYDVYVKYEEGGIGTEKVFLGKSENYDNKGNYDNTDNSLLHISNNTKMFSLLQGGSYIYTQYELVAGEAFTDEAYKEYQEICNRFDGQLERVKYLTFNDDEAKGRKPEPFRYPHYRGSPLYLRYMSAQDQFPDATVVMRLGDFYEVMGDKAKEAAETLDITLTGRDCGLDERVPMCGFPFHVRENYIDQLLTNGAVVMLEPEQEPTYLPAKETVIEEAPEAEVEEEIEEEAEGEAEDFEDGEIDEEEVEEKPIKPVKDEKGIKDRKRKIKPQLSMFDLIDEDNEKSQEEALIKLSLRHGSGIQGGKVRIYDKYQENPTKTEYANFLKKEYGTGGWSGPNIESQMHDAKGIRIESGDKQTKVVLRWNDVAEYIADMIDDGEYFTPQEQEAYNLLLQESEERKNAESDEERIQIITRQFLSHALPKTWDGYGRLVANDFRESEDFIRNHTDELIASLEKQKEVVSAKIDGFYGINALHVEFDHQYCPRLQPKEEEQTDEVSPRSLDDEEDEDWERAIESGLMKPIERVEEKENTNLDELGFNQNEFGGAKQRYRKNVEAIKLVNQLYQEDREPTDSEKIVLASYVGWGGIPQAFDENNEKWQAEYKELKELLTQDEYDTAKGSVLNAHFTAKEVIGGIYKALYRMGVRGNNKILEPALGTGNFFGFMPEEISENARLYGVELDGVTGRIASKLYPQAHIQIKGFEQTTFPDNHFDLMVSNVPFGNYSVYDSEYSRQNFQIHDYFIAKGIDKIKPNGLMAVITSKGTLDKLTPTVRRYIAERAELVGAIRLPNDAFKQTAGTEVTSDILFFRKREEKIEATTENTEWLSIGKNEQGFELNNYYIQHPEMVCGTLAEEHGLYGIIDLTVKPDGRSLEEAISEAVSHLPEDIYENPMYRAEEAEGKIEADYNVKPLCYQAKNGKLYMRMGDEMVEQTVPNSPKDAYQRIKAMIGLRESVRRLLDLQLEGCPDTTLQTAQWELGARYDLFVKKYGYLNSQTNSKLFRDDADSALLFAVENISEDKKSATKADIFTKRTIRPYTVVTQTDDCFEALQISRNEKGYVDISFIEELTRKDYDTVLNELGNTVYRNPMQVNPEDKYSGFQTQDEYLSGEVVKKLQQARHFVAQGQTEYERNVKALEQVQPEPLKATEISVKLGASWIDKDLYKQCLCEMLRLPYWVADGVEFYYNRHDGSWRIDKSAYAKGFRMMEATQVYGTNRANAFRLFEDCMNQKATQIYDTIEDSEGRDKRVLNQAETIAAREKQNKIQEYFKNWIYADPERRDMLEQKYNSLFNQIRLPTYDGSHLKFPEMNPAIELRPHQKNAVHRITSTGNNTLLHHVVGSGKTITMIATGMKLKQYGLAQKPMYVVPNHLVQQWADEFRKTYPNANVLITQKDDLDKDKRKQFVSKVAMGDWDGIIIAQSTFAKIAISPERQIRKIREEIQSIENSIMEQWADSSSPRGAVKNLERIKKSREAVLKKLTDDSKKDNVLIFENLGVDYLFVDEADAYKNLFLYSKMNNVAGISNAASQRASDLQMKIEYINELHGGDKGVVFATGTPISNSMAEMYTLQTYLQKNTLRNLGINFFDGWAADFGETVTSLELAPSGQGYRARTRFAKFTNLPELLTLYRTFADVQTSDMVKLDVPEAVRKVVTIKPSDEVIELTQQIAERAEKIYGGGVDPHVDNMLKITSDGKKIALDPRCYDSAMSDSDVSKLNECANEIMEYYNESKGIRGTQLVFCDLSTPKKSFSDYEYGKDFDAYNDLKYKLVQRGIPAEEIVFIHEANTDQQKQALFNKVNEGTVRVLIGSTEKCGAGTNVQKRLYALHHLDAPYRPRDLIQRDGRGIRQGNLNDKVRINTYVRERTFDSYSYQILENKQRFISQIDRGDLTIREAEDIDEATLSYAEIKAITSANPKIKLKMELDNELQQLRLLEGRYKKDLYELQDKIRKTLPEQIQRQTLILERLREDMETVKEKYDPDNFSITVGNKVYTERKEGQQALFDALQVAKTDTVIAEYGGLRISLDPMVMLTTERTMTVAGAGQYQVYVSQTAYGTMNRIDGLLKELPEKEQRIVNRLEQLQNDLETAKQQVEVPFEYTERIEELSKQLTEINAELDLNKRDEIVIDDENDEGGAYMGVPEQEEQETPVRQKPRTRLSKAIENLYESEQEKSPDAFIFIYDKDSYCVIGEKAKIIGEMAEREVSTGTVNGKDTDWLVLTDEEFSSITNRLMDEKVTVKIVMPDKKQAEETFIDKADLLEQMQVDLLPDYNVTQDDMNIYGYQWNGMLPMSKSHAEEYFNMGLPIFFLEKNDTETPMESIEQIEEHTGLFGIEKDKWQTFISHKDTYPYIVAKSEVYTSLHSVLREDMSYMDGTYVDSLSEDTFEETEALKKFVQKNGVGDIEKEKAYLLTVFERGMEKFENIPVNQYGWDTFDVAHSLANHIPNEELRGVAMMYVDDKLLEAHVNVWLEDVKWLEGRKENFSMQEVDRIVEAMGENVRYSRYDTRPDKGMETRKVSDSRFYVDFDREKDKVYFEDWYKDFANEKIRPILSKRLARFEYEGKTFTPYRVFTEEEQAQDLSEMSKVLASDKDLGFADMSYPDSKVPYSREEFYEAAGRMTCDIFLCEDNGKLYIPGENELFLFTGEKVKTEEFSVSEEFEKVLDDMDLEETEEILDLKPVNYKEEVMKSVEEELKDFRGALEAMDSDEIADMSYQLYLKHNVAELITNDVLPDEIYEKLYEYRGDIIELIASKYADTDEYNERNDADFIEAIHTVAGVKEQVEESFEKLPTIVDEEEYVINSDTDYMEAVVKSAEKEFDRFRDFMLTQPQINVFYNNAKIRNYTLHLEVLQEAGYLRDSEYKILYEDRGHILEDLFNDCIGNEEADIDSYPDVARHIANYCSMKEQERQEEAEQVFEPKTPEDYVNEVCRVVEKEYEDFRREELKKGKERVFSESYQIQLYRNIFNVIRDRGYLDEDEYRVLYGERGHILSTIYDQCLATDYANFDDYDEVTNTIQQYVKNRKIELQEEQTVEEVSSPEKPQSEYFGRDNHNRVYYRLNRELNYDALGEIKERGNEHIIAAPDCFINEDWLQDRDITFLKIGTDIQEEQLTGDNVQETMQALYNRKKPLQHLEVNMTLRKDIEDTVEKNFDGMHLGEGFEQELIDLYGLERVRYVLANTVQQKMDDGRFSPQNKEWAKGIPILGRENEKRYFVVNSHPAVLDGVINRVRKIENKNMEEKQEMPEQQETPERNGLRYNKGFYTAKVPFEAVIQTRDKHSFMRMPNNGEYAGYTYNLFNNRIEAADRITDLQSDSRERCLNLYIREDQQILVRSDEKEVTLSAEDFVRAVDNTFAKDYEVVREEGEWTNMTVPSDAMRGMYEQSALFSMPTNGKYSGYSFYVPNTFVEEDTQTDEGRIKISLPEDFEVTLRNKDTHEQVKMKPTELSELINNTQKQDYVRKRVEERRVEETAKKEDDWHNVSLPQEARLGKYEKASLFKMPNGEYGAYLYYLPNAFLKENEENQTVKVGLPDDFKVTIKDSTNEDEITLSASEYMQAVRGKVKGEYAQEADRPPTYKKEGKFNEEAEARLRANVPEEMKNRPNWIAVRTKYNEEKGRLNKYLINPHTGKFAESDNPETWTSFDEAATFARENGCDALAYALDGKDKIFCIDVDHCFNDRGEPSQLVKELDGSGVDTYCERSVSGKGVHYFGKTDGLDVRTFSKDGEMEFYQKSHFITMTGDMRSEGNELKNIDNSPMRSIVEAKCEKRSEWKGCGVGVEGLSVMSDRDVTERAMKSSGGETFTKLYKGENIFNDHSRSDMSLMSRLAYWCNGDKEQMLRIFATSGLYRPDKSPDYYECTAIKSIMGNTGRFQPNGNGNKPTTPKKTTGGNGKR